MRIFAHRFLPYTVTDVLNFNTWHVKVLPELQKMTANMWVVLMCNTGGLCMSQKRGLVSRH